MLFIAENERENELVQKLAKEYGGTAYERQDAYGVTIWSVRDVLQSRPELTAENAADFLEMYERRLRENSISGGWDFIDNADISEFKEFPKEYKGMKIFEQDGLYTVGGEDNACFDDCTLENLSSHLDEKELVDYCREHNCELVFENLYGSGGFVSYEKYLEHLARYDLEPDGDFLNEEFIVPEVRFASLDDAKSFVDWADEYTQSPSFKIERLEKQAKALGGVLHFTEDNLIDERHLNCFWYDSGSVAVFEYKGFECSVEVHGDISLGVLDESLENEILAFGKRNGQPAYKDDDVMAVICDDAGLQALAEQGRLSWSLNNWVELRVFDENGKEVALHEDNVLDDNLLEAVDSLDWFAQVVDEICQARATAPVSLEDKIKSAAEKAEAQPATLHNEREQIK